MFAYGLFTKSYSQDSRREITRNGPAIVLSLLLQGSSLQENLGTHRLRVYEDSGTVC